MSTFFQKMISSKLSAHVSVHALTLVQIYNRKIKALSIRIISISYRNVQPRLRKRKQKCIAIQILMKCFFADIKKKIRIKTSQNIYSET